MKRALALGLAAMMAASTVAVTTAEAGHRGWKGGDWDWDYKYKYKKHYKKKHDDFNPVVPFLFGSIVGLAVGSAFAAPPPPPYPYPAYGPYYYGDPHVQWCLTAYPNTYSPVTNTYYKSVGVVAICISPYGPY